MRFFPLSCLMCFLFFPFWTSWLILKIYFQLHLFIHIYCEGLAREAGICAWSQDRQWPPLPAQAPRCCPSLGSGQDCVVCTSSPQPGTHRAAMQGNCSSGQALQQHLGWRQLPWDKVGPGCGCPSSSWPRPPQPNPYLLWSLTSPTHLQLMCILIKSRIIPSHWGA